MSLVEKEWRIRGIAAIVKDEGAPFGPPFNATIGEVVAGYQRAVRELRIELAQAKRTE